MLACALLPLLTAAAAARDWTQKFTFNTTADVGNPLVGFVHYAPDAEPHPVPARAADGRRTLAAAGGAACSANTGVPHSLENFYLPMRALMSGPNPDFTLDGGLERNLAGVAARGHQAIFRVYLDYPGKTRSPADAVPDFLIPGLRFYSYSDGVSPDWENATLIDAIVQLIGAMGARYDADPRIAAVQVGFLGHWGEWHDEKPVPWASEAVQARVLKIFNASFAVTQVMARYPDVLGGLPARSLRIGFHDDMFAQDTFINRSWSFMNSLECAEATEQWRRAANGGEFCPKLQACFFADPDPVKACASAGPDYVPDGDFAADAAATHSSWQWNDECKAYDGAALGRAVAASASMGYKFFLASATVRGGAVTAAVENRGVAPFYYPVALRVKCGGADAALAPAAGEAPLSELMPGESQELHAQLPGGSATCTVYLKSRWAPHGARFAIAEAQVPFSGGIGVTIGSGACDAALRAACPLYSRDINRTAHEVIMCDACAGKHQGGLRDAGCTAAEVQAWCAKTGQGVVEGIVMK